MDTVVSAHESIDSQHKARRKGIICKLDLEKAYDMIDWHFLAFVLSTMGFSRRWCLWMFECMCSTHFSVLNQWAIQFQRYSSR